MFTEYMGFKIHISRINIDQYAIHVDGPGGIASGIFTPPTDDAMYRTLTERIQRFNASEDDLEALGQILFSSIFRGNIKDIYRRSQGILDSSQGLRMYFILSLADMEVAGLPWEFLYDPDQGPLALLDTSIVRYLPELIQIPTLKIKLPLKILLTGAQPSELAPIEIEHELEEIQTALVDMKKRVQIVVEPHLTLSKFVQLLRQGFHVWHFVGHSKIPENGGRCGLYFENSNGNAEVINALQLGILLGRSGLRLVVLAAEDTARLIDAPSASLAPSLIRAHIPMVIAMQSLLPPKRTHAFTGEFYRSLAEGFPIDACVTEGRKAVLGDLGLGHPNWASPVIYTCALDGKLFELPKPSKPTRPFEKTINLTIIQRAPSYEFMVQSGGVMRAFLNLSETQIAELIAYARDVLKSIIFTLVDKQHIYIREDTKIPLAVHQESLKKLAELGYYLFQELFRAPGNRADARVMENHVRQLSRQGQLRIKITTERFVFPWALLYDREPLDLDHVDPEGFWGYRHIIECLPEYKDKAPATFLPQITADNQLKIGFFVNTTIDAQFHTSVIQKQREFLGKLPDVDVREYSKCQDLFDLLNDADNPAQILYFYCHAVGSLPSDQGGVAESRILLSDGAVSLRNLKIKAPIGEQPLKQAPLVFLNACQSAKLSPYLYDGLVPYLVAKGACGVLGTEVDTPIWFAAEFAQEFFRRFVTGEQSLGELLLSLRREYLLRKNNILGLVYALYGSGDAIVQRAD